LRYSAKECRFVDDAFKADKPCFARMLPAPCLCAEALADALHAVDHDDLPRAQSAFKRAENLFGNLRRSKVCGDRSLISSLQLVQGSRNIEEAELRVEFASALGWAGELHFGINAECLKEDRAMLQKSRATFFQ
jgi:hypothetical protein